MGNCVPYPDPLYYKRTTNCGCSSSNNNFPPTCNTQGKCVFYSGKNLFPVGIFTGDSLDSALYKLNQYLINGGSQTSGTSFTVDTVADLRNTQPIANSNFSVLGYYAEGDEGGGDFYWDPTNTQTDNGGTIIAGNGITTGRWIRRVEGHHINVRWFGAKGDGTTNDSPFLQAAINTFQSTGATILIPAGTFMLAGITVPSGFKIYSNQYAVNNYLADVPAKIMPVNGSTGYIFTCVTGINMNWYFENLYINCNHAQNPNLQGALSLSGTFCSVSGCNIIDAPTSAIVSSAGAIRLNDNNIQGMVEPIFPDSQPTTIIGALHVTAVGDSYIENNEIGAGSAYSSLKDSQRRSVAFYGADVVNSVVKGNIFENGDQAAYIAGGEYMYFSGNRYEMNAAGGLNLAAMFSCTFVGERFTNNSCATTATYYDLTIGSGTQGIEFYSPTFVQQPNEAEPSWSNQVKYNIVNLGSINNVLHEPSWFANYCANGVPVDPTEFPMKMVRGDYNLDDPTFDTVTVQGITTTNPWLPVAQSTGYLKLIPGTTTGSGSFTGGVEFYNASNTRCALIGFSQVPNLNFSLDAAGLYFFSNGNLEVAKPGTCSIIATSSDGTGAPSFELIANDFLAQLSLDNTNGNLDVAVSGSVVFNAGNWTFLNTGLSLIPLAPTTSTGEFTVLTRNTSTGAFEQVPSSTFTGGTKPLTGIAGNGTANDPITGQTTYQNNALIGLGGTSERLMININGAPMVSFGSASLFSFNNTSGTISDLPNAWVAGDSLYIDLNQ
jgi:hypothetical protein